MQINVLNNIKLSRPQKVELFLHILFWLFIFTSIRVDWTSNWFDKSIRPDSPAPLSVLLFFFQFYINAFFLIPRFFNLKKAPYYILGSILFFFLPELLRSGFIGFLDNGVSFKEELFSRDSFLFGSPSILPLSIFLSFAYRFTHNWFSNIRKNEQLEALKIKNELAQLKAQINPHFLFNNLNTLDNLIDPKNEKASNYLHKLSSIYRYFLKNTDKDLISLKKIMGHKGTI